MRKARLEAAIEAAAKTMHDTAREGRMLRWETASEAWREEMRAFVRPLVTAALSAADAEAAGEFLRDGPQDRAD